MSDQNQSTISHKLGLTALWGTLSLFLVHLLCQSATAQIQFEKVNFPLFDTLAVYPTHFAIGDLNQDSLEDLVIGANGSAPFYYLYEPDSAQLDIKTHRSIDGFVLSNLGHINIMDQDNNRTNELIFAYNRFEQAPQAYEYLSDSDTLERVALRGGYAAQGFRGSNFYGFFDFNNDGLLDGLQGNASTKTSTNFFFSNFFLQNNLGYTQISNDLTNTFGRTQSIYAFDFDRNGFVDILEVHSSVGGNSINYQQDHFFKGSETGLREQFGHPLSGFTASLGVAVGDYNNDGLLDIYQPIGGSTSSNLLFTNTGDLNFKSTNNTTTKDQLFSRAAKWGDIDNDGDLDLMVVEFTGASGIGAYSSLYRNDGPDSNGDWQFTKVSSGGVPVLSSLGFWYNGTLFDFNYDGRLDVLLMGETTVEPIVIFKNNDTRYNWVGFTFEQTNAFFPQGYNVKVTLTAELDSGKETTQYRELSPFHGHGAQQSMRMHFGLKNATSASVRIEWPSGLIEERTFNQNQINSYHHLTEPPGGKMVLLNEQPYQIIAELDEITRDTLYLSNIGEAEVTISSIDDNKPYLSVTDFSNQIAPRDTGFVAVEYNPNSTLYLGSRQDTLTLASSSLNGLSNIILQSDIRTQPALFTRKTTEITEPFLLNDNVYSVPHVTDMNGDTLPEIFFQRIDSTDHLFVFDSENNVVQNSPRWMSNSLSTISDLGFGDFNLDGLIDVYVAKFGEPDEAYLTQYENGVFSYLKMDLPDAEQNSKSTKVEIVDINGDRYNDVLVARSSGQRNGLYLGRPDGSLAKQISETNDFINEINSAVYVETGHINNDNLLDLVLVQRNSSNGDRIEILLQNESHEFNQITVPGITDREYSAAGVILFDHDNNLTDDLLLVSQTAQRPSELWSNNGSGTFNQVYQETFETIIGTPSDVNILDFNGDGFKDIFFTEETFSGQNKLLQSTGGNDYLTINSGELVTNKAVSSLGTTTLDYNGDGLPDILTGNYFSPAYLYINEPMGNSANRIKIVTPEYNGSEPTALWSNTTVDVTAVVGGEQQNQRYVFGETGLFGENLAHLIVGISDAEQASVTITDPSGRSQTINNVPANSTVRIGIENVTTEPLTDIPNRFTLSQAYPNPFNPATTLNVTLPESGEVNASVFNIVGQKVATLVNGHLSSGEHQIEFESSNLSSGIYLVVLRFGNQVKMRKITLLK